MREFLLATAAGLTISAIAALLGCIVAIIHMKFFWRD